MVEPGLGSMSNSESSPENHTGKLFSLLRITAYLYLSLIVGDRLWAIGSFRLPGIGEIDSPPVALITASILFGCVFGIFETWGPYSAMAVWSVSFLAFSYFIVGLNPDNDPYALSGTLAWTILTAAVVVVPVSLIQLGRGNLPKGQFDDEGSKSRG